MKRYAIMREAGRQAKRRGRWQHDQLPDLSPRPRRVAVVEGTSEADALGTFLAERYVETQNRQYAGRRYEWQSIHAFGDKWHADDFKDNVGRRWRVVVTLANGVNRHEVRFVAWKKER